MSFLKGNVGVAASSFIEKTNQIHQIKKYSHGALALIILLLLLFLKVIRE
jgi:hypothetical protein